MYQSIECPATVLLYHADGYDPLGPVGRIPLGLVTMRRLLKTIPGSAFFVELLVEVIICSFYVASEAVQLADSRLYAPISVSSLGSYFLEDATLRNGRSVRLGGAEYLSQKCPNCFGDQGSERIACSL